MVKIVIAKYQDILDDILELFEISFQQKSSKEHFIWKYLENPYSKDKTELVVAIDKNKIVGARCFLTLELWINNKQTIVLQPCDTMVHPDYRRQGIFKRMNEYTIKYFSEKGIPFLFNFPNSFSRPGCLKQGWYIVKKTEMLYCFLQPDHILQQKIGNKLIGGSIGKIIEPFFHGRFPSLHKIYTAEVRTDYCEDMKTIAEWRSASIDLVRDKKFLIWRFDRRPCYLYRYIILKKEEQIVGFAVINLHETNLYLKHGLIVDYIVKDNNEIYTSLLIIECIKELQHLGCDFISIWKNNDMNDDLIHQCGFKSTSIFPYNKIFKQELYLLVCNLSINNDKDANIFIPDSWRLTFAFTDTM